MLRLRQRRSTAPVRKPEEISVLKYAIARAMAAPRHCLQQAALAAKAAKNTAAAAGARARWPGTVGWPSRRPVPK